MRFNWFFFSWNLKKNSNENIKINILPIQFHGEILKYFWFQKLQGDITTPETYWWIYPISVSIFFFLGGEY